MSKTRVQPDTTREKSNTKANKKNNDRKNKGIIESNERNEKASNLDKIDLTTISTFDDFPISEKTIKGLSNAGFTKPTDIQKEGIAIALQGHDVLGAAKTGSGKTLAFLVPVLELLWHDKWSNINGLGALVISPTRELALQTYDVLRKVGNHHDFSAGLIIGGKDLFEEQQRILNTNIIIGTPGRILQHFDETPNFACLDLKILVLDEADRILDLGFSRTVNAIIENLPEERQTLLFSATQTKSVKDLARLSLRKPEYVAVHETAKYITPKKLIQNYIILELQDKINFLFSFVRNHLKSKCIVFLSSCKQVKYMYEVFRKLRPGIPLTALYGKQKQLKRVAIYNRFCKINNAVLFATDIAARGLDFPAVNWVLQFDCPENADTYIHRVGRTARYSKGGQALLMLLPSEEAIVQKLIEKKIPIHELKSNPKKITSIQGKLQSLCVQDQQIKYWAQRSIISYTRSVYLQGDKSVFDVSKLPIDAFSHSCGLLTTPKLQFIKKMVKKVGPIDDQKDCEHLSNIFENVDPSGVKLTEKFNINESSDDDDCDDVLVKKNDNLHHEVLEDLKTNDDKRTSGRKKMTKTGFAKKIISKHINVASKIIFNEDGGIRDETDKNDKSSDDDDDDDDDGINLVEAKKYMEVQDRIDREKEKKRIKRKHQESKKKEKKERIDVLETLGVQLNFPEGDNMTSEDESTEEVEIEGLPTKRQKQTTDVSSTKHKIQPNISSTLDDDEGLALHLLGVCS